MKAAYYEKYGAPEVVRIIDITRPEAGPGEVRVRVRATTVSAGDARLRASRVPWIFWLPMRVIQGFVRPKNRILGGSFAGTIDAVGAGVENFRPGDPVWGSTEMSGAHAEYLTIKADGVIGPKPQSLSFEEAAAIPFGANTGLQFVRDVGKVQQGERVLILGASGAVGSYSVQIAKSLGAEVTAVCSGRNVELVRGLGADHVVDYHNEDWAARGETYDVIMDCVGATKFPAARKCLAPSGRYLVVNGAAAEIFWVLRTMLGSKQKALLSVAMGTNQTMKELAAMVDAGALKPVIDSVYPFVEIVDAHRLVDSGRKRGAAVVTVSTE